jgi:hypothetical protein
VRDFLAGIGRSFITRVTVDLNGRDEEEGMGMLAQCTGLQELTSMLECFIAMPGEKLYEVSGVRELMEIRGCKKVAIEQAPMCGVVTSNTRS